MNLEQKIIGIMQSVFGTEDITAESTQETVENWTSLRHLNLASELEDEFDIDLDPSEICCMKSVAQIEEVIRKKL